LARHDPALLASRLSSPIQADQKPWDRVFIGVAGVAFAAWTALIAVDHRLHGSRAPPWAQAAGALIIAAGLLLVWRTFRVNSFAAPQVRMQLDRGQRVITEGPYRVVRHPMYAGALFYLAGTPLLLGSWWGLAPVPLFVIGLGARTVGEERMLRGELTGYGAYARQVRFRLFPGIW
jgi:protein-S-isoprenylcysteine O-methyltransferase Ste14